MSLSYDPAGRLYQTAQASGATTRFLYDGANLIGEYNASNALLRRYVQGPGLDAPLVRYDGTGTGSRRWLITDERGSVVAETNASGAAVQINTYDEYGMPGSGNTSRFGYTGQMWIAEIGLYHYRNRVYNPAIGRFMQTDPIGQQGGINLYAYVGNDPVNYTDPWGLSRISSGDSPHQDGPGIVEIITVTGTRMKREPWRRELILSGNLASLAWNSAGFLVDLFGGSGPAADALEEEERCPSQVTRGQGESSNPRNGRYPTFRSALLAAADMVAASEMLFRHNRQNVADSQKAVTIYAPWIGGGYMISPALHSGNVVDLPIIGVPRSTRGSVVPVPSGLRPGARNNIAVVTSSLYRQPGSGRALSLAGLIRVTNSAAVYQASPHGSVATLLSASPNARCAR